MSANLSSYLFLSLILFSIGVYGILSRKNIISILISLEIILNAANLNFLAFGKFCTASPAVAQTLAIFVIAIAACEICIALSIVLLISRRKKSILISDMKELKG